MNSNSSSLNAIVRFILQDAVDYPDLSDEFINQHFPKLWSMEKVIEDALSAALRIRYESDRFPMKSLVKIVEEYQDKCQKGKALDRRIHLFLCKIDNRNIKCLIYQSLSTLKFPEGTMSAEKLSSLMKDHQYYHAGQPVISAEQRPQELEKYCEQIEEDLVKKQQEIERKNQELLVKDSRIEEFIGKISDLEIELGYGLQEQPQSSTCTKNHKVNKLKDVYAVTLVHLVEKQKKIEQQEWQLHQNVQEIAALQKEILELKSAPKSALIDPQAATQARGSNTKS